MFIAIKNIFGPDNEHYEGVYKINIYLLRLLFFRMFLVVGKSAWTHLLTFQGPSTPTEAVHGASGPLKMLPIIAMPWKYAFGNYVFKPKKSTGTIRQLSNRTT